MACSRAGVVGVVGVVGPRRRSRRSSASAMRRFTVASETSHAAAVSGRLRCSTRWSTHGMRRSAGHPRERVIELVDRGAVARVGRTRREVDGPEREHHPTTTTRQHPTRATHRDGDEPCAHRRRIDEALQSLDGIDERLLDDVVELAVVAHETMNDARDVPRVLRVDRLEVDRAPAPMRRRDRPSARGRAMLTTPLK